MATCSVRQIEHQPFSAFILLPPDGCLVSATISCWEMMWSTSHEHGTKKKCDFTTGIEPLSQGSTDKDWNPVPEILNPRRVLDFYLQPTYLSATSFPLKEKPDSGSGTHYILNIRLIVLAFFYSCIWLTWGSALWHKLLELTGGLSQNAKLRCTGKFSRVVLRSEFLWKLSSCTLLKCLNWRLNLPTNAALWRP